MDVKCNWSPFKENNYQFPDFPKKPNRVKDCIIIDPPKEEEHSYYEAKCSHCECKFIFNEKKLSLIKLQGVEKDKFVLCPICEHSVHNIKNIPKITYQIYEELYG